MTILIILALGVAAILVDIIAITMATGILSLYLTCCITCDTVVDLFSKNFSNLCKYYFGSELPEGACEKHVHDLMKSYGNRRKYLFYPLKFCAQDTDYTCTGEEVLTKITMVSVRFLGTLLALIVAIVLGSTLGAIALAVGIVIGFFIIVFCAVRWLYEEFSD